MIPFIGPGNHEQVQVAANQEKIAPSQLVKLEKQEEVAPELVSFEASTSC